MYIVSNLNLFNYLNLSELFMKKYWLLFVIVLFVLSLVGVFYVSCSKSMRKIVELAEKEHIIYNYDSIQKFELKNNQIIIPVDVCGIQQKWMFDACGSKLLYSKEGSFADSLVQYPLPKIALTRDVAGQSIQRNLALLDIVTCNLFSAQPLLVDCIKEDNNYRNHDGMFGSDAFIYANGDNSAEILKIDFDNQYLQCLKNIPSDEEWIPVKSKYKLLKDFVIYLTINNKEYSFHFDTGSQGCIDFGKADKNIENIETTQTIYGDLFYTFSGNYISDTMEIKQYKVSLNEDNYINADIRLVPKFNHNIVGMKFIQSYNWILDYKNGQLYFQKRNTPYEPDSGNNPLMNPDLFGADFAFSEKNEIRKIIKDGRAESAGIEIGDIIIEINGVKLENIEKKSRKKLMKEIIETSTNINLLIERNGKIIEIKM